MAHPANAGPPRPQMLAKNEEIEQQVKDMLVTKIIRSLKQSYYLQVHLTPKWRICKDYEDLTSR